MTTDDSIRVFVSSKCGGERLGFNRLITSPANDKEDIAERAVRTNYDLVRHALRARLEATGFIQTYVFEDEPASTASARQEYLDALDTCHVCLFLIDNFDESPPEGILEEIARAKNSGKKCIFLFLNDPSREPTVIQKSRTGPDGSQYLEIRDVREFIDEGVRSVISDILKTYQRYCRGRIGYVETEASQVQVSKESFPVHAADIEAQVFTSLELARKKIAGLVSAAHADGEPSSRLDAFCVSVLEVILGEKNFDEIDLPGLLEELKSIQPPELHRLVESRWKAIATFYTGDLEQAIAELSAAYAEFSDDPAMPRWLLNDILIDWRNWEYIAAQIENTMSSVAQEKINQQNSTIFFPLLDRFSTNISDDIWRRSFNALTSSPFSTTFYNLEHLFAYISNYLLTAVYYASYTHLRLTLKQIQKILLELVEEENSLLHKIQLIRTSILIGDESAAEKVLATYKSALSHSTPPEILDIYRLADTKPTPYERATWKVRVFAELGYYFSDADYETISNEIISLSHKWLTDENPNVALGERLVTALESNRERLSLEEIVGFALGVLAKKFYRYLHSVLRMLEQLDFAALPAELLNRLLTELKELIVSREANDYASNLQHLLLKIRKRRSDLASDLDEIVGTKYPEFYKGDYHLEIAPGERAAHIGRFVETIRTRNKVQGKGGRFIGHGDRPYLTITRIFEIDKPPLSEALLGELLDAIAETLLSDTQTFSEKIDSIQLLLCLKRQPLSFAYDWVGYFSVLKLRWAEILKAYPGVFEQESGLLLQLYLAMTRAAFGENALQDFLEALALINNGSDADIIESLTALDDFLAVEKTSPIGSPLIPAIVQYALAFCFHKDDNIRFWTVPVLYRLLDTSYADFVISTLGKMMDDDDYRVKLTILNQASLMKGVSTTTFNYVLAKAKIDNNYLVRSGGAKYQTDVLGKP